MMVRSLVHEARFGSIVLFSPARFRVITCGVEFAAVEEFAPLVELVEQALVKIRDTMTSVDRIERINVFLFIQPPYRFSLCKNIFNNVIEWRRHRGKEPLTLIYRVGLMDIPLMTDNVMLTLGYSNV
jgi:hypothetical protein